MNVVVIITDSLRVDHVGCYGSHVKTPNIDRLAEEGVKFRYAYSENLPTMRYKVAIEGKDVVIYTDGNKEQVRASFPKMPVGSVGLANENTTTHFDDFVASGPKVKSGGKFALEPAGNLVICWGKIKAR